MTSVGIMNSQHHLELQQPTSNRSSPYVATGSSSPLPSFKNLRILLVDDNLVCLRILNTLLNRRFPSFLAHPPVSVDSGLKALQQLRYQVFDLILMDIQMPFLSGVECTKRIRAGEAGIIPANREAHIVAVTTCHAPEASATYQETGFSGLIAKPVRFQELSDFIVPFSKEAFSSEKGIEKFKSFGKMIYPPLPPTSAEGERTYFDTTTSKVLPSTYSRAKRSTTLNEELLQVENGQSTSNSISNSDNFAILLAAQTRGSLREKNGGFLNTRNGGLRVESTSNSDPNSGDNSSRASNSSDEPPVLAQFDQEMFQEQVLDELEAAKIFDLSQKDLGQNVDELGQLIPRPSSSSLALNRKQLLHRLSSPAFLIESGSSGFPEE